MSNFSQRIKLTTTSQRSCYNTLMRRFHWRVFAVGILWLSALILGLYASTHPSFDAYIPSLVLFLLGLLIFLNPRNPQQ